MISRGLTAGSFGILEVERGNQRFVVRWNGLLVFLEALDIAGDGVPGHFLGFTQRSAVRDAARQHRHDRCETALGLGPQHHIKMSAGFLHWHLHLIGWGPRRSILLERGRAYSTMNPPKGIDACNPEGAEGDSRPAAEVRFRRRVRTTNCRLPKRKPGLTQLSQPRWLVLSSSGPRV